MRQIVQDAQAAPEHRPQAEPRQVSRKVAVADQLSNGRAGLCGNEVEAGAEHRVGQETSRRGCAPGADIDGDKDSSRHAWALTEVGLKSVPGGIEALGCGGLAWRPAHCDRVPSGFTLRENALV